MTRDPSDRLGATAALRALEDMRETGTLGRAMRDLDSHRALQKAMEDANRSTSLLNAVGGGGLIEEAMRKQNAMDATIGSGSAIEAAMRAQNAMDATIGSGSAIEAAMRAQNAIDAATSKVLSALGRPADTYPNAVREMRAPLPSRPAPKRDPVTSPADLGYIVRRRRQAQGLSQQDLADAAGTGRRFISELESGKPTLELGKVIQVCATLGLDLIAAPR